MRAIPTDVAQRADGAIIYHLGYLMERDVASEKARAVCRDGKEEP